MCRFCMGKFRLAKASVMSSIIAAGPHRNAIRSSNSGTTCRKQAHHTMETLEALILQGNSPQTTVVSFTKHILLSIQANNHGDAGFTSFNCAAVNLPLQPTQNMSVALAAHFFEPKAHEPSPVTLTCIRTDPSSPLLLSCAFCTCMHASL